jgi:hypothetical protein
MDLFRKADWTSGSVGSAIAPALSSAVVVTTPGPWGGTSFSGTKCKKKAAMPIIAMAAAAITGAKSPRQYLLGSGIKFVPYLDFFSSSFLS